MCSINHDLKCVFIHINKVGGTYISYILHKYYGFKNYYIHRPDHDKYVGNKKKTTKYLNYENRTKGVLQYYKTSPFINKKMGMNATKWNTYFKFCFIRNPYDRIISGFNHVNRYNLPFDNYLNLEKRVNDVEYIHVFMPQYKHIIDETGKPFVNYVGKFENLEDDLRFVLKTIGVRFIIHEQKFMNKREHMEFYKYYNQSALDKVNIFMWNDFKLFGFNMISNIQEFRNSYKNTSETNDVKQINEIDEINNNIIVKVNDDITDDITDEELNELLDHAENSLLIDEAMDKAENSLLIDDAMDKAENTDINIDIHNIYTDMNKIFVK